MSRSPSPLTEGRVTSPQFEDPHGRYLSVDSHMPVYSSGHSSSQSGINRHRVKEDNPSVRATISSRHCHGSHLPKGALMSAGSLVNGMPLTFGAHPKKLPYLKIPPKNSPPRSPPRSPDVSVRDSLDVHRGVRDLCPSPSDIRDKGSSRESSPPPTSFGAPCFMLPVAQLPKSSGTGGFAVAIPTTQAQTDKPQYVFNIPGLASAEGSSDGLSDADSTSRPRFIAFQVPIRAQQTKSTKNNRK